MGRVACRVVPVWCERRAARWCWRGWLWLAPAGQLAFFDQQAAGRDHLGLSGGRFAQFIASDLKTSGGIS